MSTCRRAAQAATSSVLRTDPKLCVNFREADQSTFETRMSEFWRDELVNLFLLLRLVSSIERLGTQQDSHGQILALAWPCSGKSNSSRSLLFRQRVLPEREFVIDNLLVRIHFIITMIRWTGLAPREFEFPFPGSLTSTFLVNQGRQEAVP